MDAGSGIMSADGFEILAGVDPVRVKQSLPAVGGFPPLGRRTFNERLFRIDVVLSIVWMLLTKVILAFDVGSIIVEDFEDNGGSDE